MILHAYGVGIDVDTYPLDYGVIVSKIRNLKLPLVMCRSKSGGAHIFLFTKEPVPAKLIREKLNEVGRRVRLCKL